jgi:transposase-like protein
VSRPDFPRTIIEFQHRFPDEDACRQYLFESRWPQGFRCPRCGSEAATGLPRRLLWQCSACRYQVSVTAGTVLHRTRTPLHLWFWAAYLVTTGTPGISALQLQRQLGLKRYETSWTMLHKLRRAMVNPEREPLTGVVEVDECFVGGHEPGLRGGRQQGIKALVIVAVEVRGAGSGRIRMQVIDDASADTLCDFVAESIAAGATVRTDGWSGYKRLARLGFDHQPRSQRAHHLLGEDPDEILPRVHRVISHLKTWLQGTHRGVSEEYLQVYLDEFTFRFNRRRTPMAAFQRVLGLGSQQGPTTHEEILAEGPGAARRAAEFNG